MMKVLQYVFFYLIVLLLLPVIVVGVVLYTLPILHQRGKVSGTAYEPMQVRLCMHWLGTRNDPAADVLAPKLPAFRFPVIPLGFTPFAWAARVTGTDFHGAFAYPPSTRGGIAVAASARTWWIDRAMEDALPTARQLVILGAGWDTRAWRLGGSDVRVFEVDAPATSAVKVRAVSEAGLDTSHITFVACDFEQTSWLQALIGAGFDRSVPTFLIWEGVSMYLQESTVKATLAMVAELAWFDPGIRGLRTTGWGARW